jgi:hypothetical protein
MRRLGAVLVGLGAVYVLLVGALALAMRQPPAVFGQIMKHVPGPMFLVLPFEPLWMWARAGNLKPRDPAPGFVLSTPDRKSTAGLAEHRGTRPVVLIFGSYT